MNMHAVAGGLVGVINPPILCTLMVSTGYTIASDGSQVPAYSATTNVPVQVQAMSYGDLAKSGGLNVEGTRRKVYMFGNIEGLDRNVIKGGDLVVMPNLPDFPGPTTWLVAMVMEHWPGWSCLAITLQNT